MTKLEHSIKRGIIKILIVEKMAGRYKQSDSNLQSRYRSGVGILLNLRKYSQPDFFNVIRELSKCMNKASMGTYLEILTVIKFVIDTKCFSHRI
jgi:hypothetical protein